MTGPDCGGFMFWLGSHVAPPLLWTVWQRYGRGTGRCRRNRRFVSVGERGATVYRCYAARGNIILFLHADSRLTEGGLT